MCKIDNRFQTFWTLASAARRGEVKALGGLELLATGYGKSAELAKAFLRGQEKRGLENADASG